MTSREICCLPKKCYTLMQTFNEYVHLCTDIFLLITIKDVQDLVENFVSFTPNNHTCIRILSGKFSKKGTYGFLGF